MRTSILKNLLPLLAVLSWVGTPAIAATGKKAAKTASKKEAAKSEDSAAAAAAASATHGQAPEAKGATVELQPAAGKTIFKATGRPSALKIVGESPGPSGTVKVVEGQIRGALILDLNGLDTGINLRNNHMKEKYLEVQKYPKATLTLSQAAFPATDVSKNFSYEKLPFLGTLNLHGVDKPVSGTADISRSGKTVKVKADFTLKLPEFGMDIPKYMGITVAEDVSISVETSGAVQE